MPGQRRSYPKSFKAQVVDECPLAPSLPATPSAADMAIQIAIPHRAGKRSVQWPGNDPEAAPASCASC